MSGGKILGAGRVPTRGRKGSADSLRGAAALVRRLERQVGVTVGEVRIAPLRPVDTSVLAVSDVAPPGGRLRVLAAGVRTPGGTGSCVGPPLLLAAPESSGSPESSRPPQLPKPPQPLEPVVAVVPAGLRYDEAAARLRVLLAAGTRLGAVLVAADEGVLIANRIPGDLPVIDQVDAIAAAACERLAVEVQLPGHSLRLLADPVALGAPPRSRRVRHRRRGCRVPDADRPRQWRRRPAGCAARRCAAATPGRALGGNRGRRTPSAASRMRAARRLASRRRARVRDPLRSQRGR